jgi:hypothetical protein
LRPRSRRELLEGRASPRCPTLRPGSRACRLPTELLRGAVRIAQVHRACQRTVSA